MGEENRSAVEQYAEIKLKEEREKASTKKWVTIIVLGVVLLGIVGNFFSSMYLNSSTAKKILETTFNSNADNYIFNDNEDYLLIGVQADSKQDALLHLRSAYLEMSKKQVSKLNKLAVVIYDSSNQVIFNSNITVEEIMNTNWSKELTYTEFMKMANVQ